MYSKYPVVVIKLVIRVITHSPLGSVIRAVKKNNGRFGLHGLTRVARDCSNLFLLQ
jgi:ABC-type branched-subunit amino acid transport system permease subunit